MIFGRVKEKSIERLQNVLISDKQFSPLKVEKVLRCDMFNLLSNYCSLSPENLNVKVSVEKDGSYLFSISAISNRLKIFGSLPESYQ